MKIMVMIPARILVIDDNVQILESLRILLKDEFAGIDVLTKPSGMKGFSGSMRS
jgi:hypothetical protein